MSFIKRLIFIVFILLPGCRNEIRLTEKEQALAGSWKRPIYNQSNMVYSYIELREDRTGIHGSVLDVKGKIGIEKVLSFVIADWHVRNDSLIIQSHMHEGFVLEGPDGKRVEPNNEPYYEYRIIWEVTDDHIVLENLIVPFRTKDRYERSERFELLER